MPIHHDRRYRLMARCVVVAKGSEVRSSPLIESTGGQAEWMDSGVQSLERRLRF